MVPVVDGNWQTPQPPGALSPVPCTLQLWRLPKAQKDPDTVPVRPVLLESVRICREEEKVEGSGTERLLESKWSSASEEKEDIEEGMTPEMDVEERSLRAV